MVDHRQELEFLYQRKKKLLSLKEHPGYAELQALVAAQVTARRQAVFQTQIRSLDNCFEVCASTHEVAGMQVALALVDLALADIEQDIQVKLEQARSTDGTE